MARRISLTRAQKIYDRLRTKFFMDGDRTPPPAKCLIWRWVDSKDSHAWTQFDLQDSDHDPFEVALDLGLRDTPRMLMLCLLHELTHMRLGPKHSCAPASPAWKAEIRRLAGLGAFDGLF